MHSNSAEILSLLSRLAPGAGDPDAVARYSATPGRPVDAIRDCALFIGEVVRLGARPEAIGLLEDAYWQLLDGKTLSGPLEQKPLFQSEVRTVDAGTIETVTRELGATAPAVAQELTALVHAAELAAYADGVEAGVREGGAAAKVFVGPLLRAAAFITLGIKSGVPQDNLLELRRLVVGRVLTSDLKLFSARLGELAEDSEAAIGEDVRQRLGISKEEWEKDGDSLIQTFSPRSFESIRAQLDATAGGVGERVRKQLGISKADWDKIG